MRLLLYLSLLTGVSFAPLPHETSRPQAMFAIKDAVARHVPYGYAPAYINAEVVQQLLDTTAVGQALDDYYVWFIVRTRYWDHRTEVLEIVRVDLTRPFDIEAREAQRAGTWLEPLWGPYLSYEDAAAVLTES